MGNSRAFPVLRTTDAAEAYACGVRLRAALEHCDKVRVYAILQTVQDVRRLAGLLPLSGADIAYYEGRRTDPVTGEPLRFDLDVTTLDDATLERHLPLSVMECFPEKSVDERFPAALGEDLADLSWYGRWPDDPSTEFLGSHSDDGVQVLFHGDMSQWGDVTEHHTVFVHVGWEDDLPWVEALAARFGYEVVGEPQLGW